MPAEPRIASLFSSSTEPATPTPFDPGLRAPAGPAVLTPAWKPVVLPADCAPYGTAPFRPVVLDTLAIAIVGGPNALHVVEIYDRQRLWFTIPARVRLAGFAVHEGLLYVQDGPVLSSYSLVGEALDGAPHTQFCAGAINLVARMAGASVQFAGWTRQHGSFTTGPGGSRYSGAHEGPLDEAALADLFALPPEAAARQQAVQTLRAVEKWAFLSDAFPARYVRRYSDYWPRSVARALADLMAIDDDAFDEDMQAGANAVHAARAQAEAAASAVVFSAPVVRRHQLAGKPGGMVFSQGADGTVHALDNSLTLISTASFARAARAGLAIAEPPVGTTGNYDCWLFAARADGGIQGLNGASFPPTALTQWDGTRPADPGSVLPLSFTDGLLWGGGVLDGGFFALPPNPMLGPAVLDIPPPGGPWRDYEVQEAAKLALVTDGSTTRIASYAQDARVRDRWPPHTSPAAAWVQFWRGAGHDRDPRQPVLVLELDTLGNLNATLRAYAVPGVEPARPELASLYPAQPQAIGSATLDPGSFAAAMPRIALVPQRPAIERDMLYVLARSVTAADEVAQIGHWDLALPGMHGMIIPYDTLAQYLANLPLPFSAGTSALLAFSLAGLADDWKQAAAAEGERLASFAQPLQLRITQERFHTTIYKLGPDTPGYRPPIPRNEHADPVPLAGVSVPLSLDGVGTFAVTPDAQGVVEFDAKHAGAGVMVDPRSVASWGEQVYVRGGGQLARGAVPTINIQVFTQSYEYV